MTELDNYLMKQVANSNKILEHHLKLAFAKKFNADFEILIKAIPQDFRCECRDMEKKFIWCDKVFLVLHSHCEYNKDKMNFSTTLEY